MRTADARHSRADWASADTPISEIANMMPNDDICVIRVGHDDTLIGITTDRDIALRVVAEGRDPAKTKAEEVMTKSIVYCRTTETVKDAIRLINHKKVDGGDRRQQEARGHAQSPRRVSLREPRDFG